MASYPTSRAPARPRLERICEQCSASFTTTASEVARRGGRFCGRGCQALAQRKLPVDGQKTCPRCGEAKPVSEFWRRAASADGLASSCKTCKGAETAAYVREHTSQLRLYQAAYRAQHRTKMAAYMRAHKAAHPDQWRDIWAKQRAMRRGAPVSDLTARQWEAIKAAYGHRCVYCGGKPARLTKDHIIPISRGGHHTASNVVPACRPCNGRKFTGAPLVPVQPVLLV